MRDSVGELEAVAAAVEAYEREKERAREEKRAKRHGGGTGEEPVQAPPPSLPEQPPPQQSTGARAVSRAAAFFGRKATPVAAGGNAGGVDKADRKPKPVAVPIEPSTPRAQAPRKPAVLVVPRRFVAATINGASASRKSSGDLGSRKQQPASPAPSSPTVMNGWKGGGLAPGARHASASAPVTPNGKGAAANGNAAQVTPACERILASCMPRPLAWEVMGPGKHARVECT